ncbi:MAG: RNA polymerase sigma-70 factor [Bacteroidales bacterium]|jgi:RNA polymerase sigma-70 factor (ECF subfamily)|nr:RNA polymerase sigma-70 factor [Bacteroidales bacterium]MBR4822821.1 RNA polymerase sigma-70 factor [Bacteroidales bacterium]MCR4570779.1 RNA polymerase sigma-70 factor [Bacteroidales bacterium]
MADNEILERMREITLAIKAGSEGVFRSVYRAEFNNLVHFVNSYTRNRLDSEDLVQETMLAIWKNRESLDPERNFRSYLYTIARNKSLNYLRDNANHLKSSSLQESETLINSLALSSPSVEEEINALDLQSFIDRVYLSLPEKVVNTFRMSRQDGFTYNEIAEKLGITVKVVEYHISITLKALRLKLGSSYNNNAVQTVRK